MVNRNGYTDIKKEAQSKRKAVNFDWKKTIEL
jgi:hypothetical protein